MQYDDNWEESFFAELGTTSHSLDQDDQEDADDGEQFDLKPHLPKITRFYPHLKTFRRSKDSHTKQQR